MKKHLTRVFAFGLVATMLFASACGGNAGNGEENGGNGNAIAPTPEPATNGIDIDTPIFVIPEDGAGVVVSGLPPYDHWGNPNFAPDGSPLNQGIEETEMNLNGRVIRMLSSQYNWYQYRADTDETAANFHEFRRRWLQIEEDYNFELELVNATGGGTAILERLMANRIGGMNDYDLLNLGVNAIHQEELFIQEHVMPLCHPAIRDIIRFEEQPFHTESSLAYMFGYQWGIHILKLQTNNLFRGVLTFNRGMMDDLNVPNFYDLFRTNEWTWDVFEQICRDIVAQDSRIVPIVQGSESSFIPHIIASNGGNLVERNADGTMTFIGDTDLATLEALDWTVRLINDDLLRHNADISRFFDMGRAMFIMGGYSNLRDRGSTGMIGTGIRVGLMPLPRGPQMDGFATRTFSSAMFYIVEGIPRPEEAAAVLVAFANRWPRTNVIEHELNYALMDTESAEVMAYLLEVMCIDFSRALGSTRSPISEAVNNVIMGNLTPVAAMQTIAPEVQAALDSAWERFENR